MSDCTNCRSSDVNRREFLTKSSALAITAVLAACGDGIGGGATGPSNVNESVVLADYTALGTVGGIAVVSGAGTPIAVVRTATSQYRAFSLICPHAGTTVAINGSGFRCPNHGATFNASGAWTGGQRTSGLSEFTVALNSTAGTITITT
ncbi:ubiquinol-cytochrome c reductase iron-sulfur subunit [Gemmatimonas sp.]|uniref:QcrA and Rieske domain-containing protein n=1 Tax=Gemmatimonas sp. TaxID=1962908 RepID=UPI00356B3304